MIFSTFNRTELGNIISFKNSTPIQKVSSFKFYKDNASGTFSKKEIRWSFSNTYWSSWEDLSQNSISAIDTNNSNVYLEIRYTKSTGSMSKVTTFSVTYESISQDISTPSYNTISLTNDSSYLNGKSGSYYINRANHIGSQPISSVTGLQQALQSLSQKVIEIDNVDGSGYGVFYGLELTTSFFKRINQGNNITLTDSSGIVTINSKDSSVDDLYNWNYIQDNSIIELRTTINIHDISINYLKTYIDGSLSTRDTSLGNLSRWNKVQDSSIVCIKNVNTRQDSSILFLINKSNVTDSSIIDLRNVNNIQESSINYLFQQNQTQDTSIVNLESSINLFLPLNGGTITGDLILDNSTTFNGNTVFNGKTFFDGSVYFLSRETIDVSSSFIKLNTGLVGSPPSNLQSGIIVGRGSSNPYVFLYDETRQEFRIGISLETSSGYLDSSTQAVSTRQDVPISNGVVYWNSSNYRFDTSSSFLFNNDNLNIDVSILSTGAIKIIKNNYGNNVPAGIILVNDTSATVVTQTQDSPFILSKINVWDTDDNISKNNYLKFKHYGISGTTTYGNWALQSSSDGVLFDNIIYQSGNNININKSTFVYNGSLGVYTDSSTPYINFILYNSSTATSSNKVYESTPLILYGSGWNGSSSARKQNFKLKQQSIADTEYGDLLYQYSNDGGSTYQDFLRLRGVYGSVNQYALFTNITEFYLDNTIHNPKLGIGTQTPSQTLDILSNNMLIGSDLNAYTRTNATDKLFRLLYPHYTNAEESITAICASGGILNIGGGVSTFNSVTRINLFTGDTSTHLRGKERITITNDGSVGINKTNPTATLDVSGNIKSNSINISEFILGTDNDKRWRFIAGTDTSSNILYIQYCANYSSSTPIWISITHITAT